MNSKECLIGAKVIFKPIETRREVVLRDYGKVGRLVGVEDSWGGSRPLIVLEGSTHISEISSPKLFVTWRTLWKDIEIVKKNQQLLFDFME